ncbi:MAG: hypothetical protein IPO58_16475 [Betaproteobacteria bacterium]|nr:hypothetical protein [Betaproteobacteria bacterium]
MSALRKNLTVTNELTVAANVTRLTAYEGYPVLATVNPEAMPVAAATVAVEHENGLKQIALLAAAPFIGLGWFLLFPFIGLGMLVTMAARALAKVAVARKALTFAKNLGLFLAAPFIGLGYIVLFPFIGMGMLIVTAVRAVVNKPAGV